MSIFGISSFSIVSLTFSLDYSSFMDHGPVPFSLKPCNNLRAAALWPVARPLAALPHIFAVACTVTVSCRNAPRCSAACNVYYVCVHRKHNKATKKRVVGGIQRALRRWARRSGRPETQERSRGKRREGAPPAERDVRRGTGTTGGEREARRRGGCGLHCTVQDSSISSQRMLATNGVLLYCSVLSSRISCPGRAPAVMTIRSTHAAPLRFTLGLQFYSATERRFCFVVAKKKSWEEMK